MLALLMTWSTCVLKDSFSSNHTPRSFTDDTRRMGGAGGGPNAQSAVADDTGRSAGVGGPDEMRLRGESDTERGPPQPMTCINAMDDGEEDPPRRRGKRRKKSKQLTQTISFVPNQDPETQIAKMDPDSPNYSARPSLVPTGKCLLSLAQDLTPPAGFGAGGTHQGGVGQPAEEDCFLDDESLGLLRRGLNIDIVEMIFERYVSEGIMALSFWKKKSQIMPGCLRFLQKGRAIREAFRTATMDKLNFQTDAVRTLQRSAKQLSDVDYEKWIDLPRKYSRSSARFELPIDTRKLTRIVSCTLSRFFMIPTILHARQSNILARNTTPFYLQA